VVFGSTSMYCSTWELARSDDRVGHLNEPCQAGRPGWVIIHSFKLPDLSSRGQKRENHLTRAFLQKLTTHHQTKLPVPDLDLLLARSKKQRQEEHNKCAADPGAWPPRYTTRPGPASSRSCLDAIQILSFFTLSLSHQFLAAYMEY
jgi:hypothetical protein